MKKELGLRIILVLLVGILSCIPKAIPIDESIEEMIKLSFDEPSGLSYSLDGNSLLCVSDRGKMYNIDFNGRLIKKYNVVFDDSEGICINPNDNSIYVVLERQGKIKKLNSEGEILSSIDILNTNDNKGLEGITYDSKRNMLYVLKEKNEGLLIKYSLDDNSIKESIRLNFALDYSGLYYNESTDHLWILSDESRSLSMCDVNGDLLQSFDFPFSGMEGIVVTPDESEAYIVADPSNLLMKVKLKY